MEDNVCWNRLGERILRTAVVRYLAMNLQRLHHLALVASAPLLDWNLLEHVLFCVGCIMSHSCVVLSMEDGLQRCKTSSEVGIELFSRVAGLGRTGWGWTGPWYGSPVACYVVQNAGLCAIRLQNP